MLPKRPSFRMGFFISKTGRLVFIVCHYNFEAKPSNIMQDSNSSAHNSSRAPEPVGLYPHARKVGNLLFLSGVGPRQRGSKKIPGVELNEAGEIISYDIETQCRAVFENVRYILEEAGSDWNKLVDVTVYLTNMKADFATYNRLYAEYFKENQPCRTTVEVLSLPTPIAIELKCIAIV